MNPSELNRALTCSWLQDLQRDPPADPLALLFKGLTDPGWVGKGPWVAARKSLAATLPGGGRGLSLLEEHLSALPLKELRWLLSAPPASPAALSVGQGLLTSAARAACAAGGPGSATPVLLSEVFPALKDLPLGPSEAEEGGPRWEPPQEWEGTLASLGWDAVFLSGVLSAGGLNLFEVEALPPEVVRPGSPRAQDPREMTRLMSLTQGCYGWLDERDPACAHCELVLLCAEQRHVYLVATAERLRLRDLAALAASSPETPASEGSGGGGSARTARRAGGKAAGAAPPSPEDPFADLLQSPSPHPQSWELATKKFLQGGDPA